VKRDTQRFQRPPALSTSGVENTISAPQTAPQASYDHHFADVGVDAPRADGGATSSNLTVQRCACKDKEEKKRVHRKEAGAGDVSLEAAMPHVEGVLSQSGTPLEASVRSEMERGFGYDFGAVRVYDDARASRSADALNAHAYTVGERVVFADGQYAPESETGQALLAHELAHVVQQGMGWTASQSGLDGGSTDPLEIAADRMAHDALNAPATPTRASIAATSSRSSPVSTEVASVQRQSRFEPYQTPGTVAGHTAGDDYQGPNGIVTQQGANSANLGGSTWLGGLTSYGCYCGPGGDATGSRCGEGAPAIDEIDEQCRQHDANYGSRGVSSVVTDPATQVSMFSGAGFLRTEDADRRLADSTDRAMRENPGAFSPTARLFGQGITGVFGARANASHAYNWGASRYGEAEAGLSGAYDDATSWMGNRAGEASSGVSDFMDSASNWDSAGDVVSGLGGGAGRALGWMGNTAGEALSGGSAALGSGLDWAINTGSEAASGLGTAAYNAANWGVDTAGAVGDVVVDQASQLGSRAWDAISNFSLSDAGIGQPLTSPALGGLLEEWF
jgi:Domain of unknown function (DUF4157)